jgi:hypothetical protein
MANSNHIQAESEIQGDTPNAVELTPIEELESTAIDVVFGLRAVVKAGYDAQGYDEFYGGLLAIIDSLADTLHRSANVCIETEKMERAGG